MIIYVISLHTLQIMVSLSFCHVVAQAMTITIDTFSVYTIILRYAVQIDMRHTL